MFKRFLLIALFALSACSSGALLDQVSLDLDTISPREGSTNPATTIHYNLGRDANVSIYLADAQGNKHYLRQDQPRAAGSYDATFSGAIDDRVLPDGKYTVAVEVKDSAGQTAKVEKPLTIVNADSVPPQFQNFTLFPDSFTPNQDGINDRVTIRYWLTKPAKVDLYVTDGKNRFEIAEKKTTICVKDDKFCPGAHEYDYDGGIDLLAPPPVNGTYTVIAEAVDAVGNRVREERKLTISESGIPRATITNSGVDWSPEGIAYSRVDKSFSLVPLGSTLTFTVTVENIGPVPLRTKGPPPGTVYTTSENFNMKQAYEEPGIWRVGMDCEGNSVGRAYPYRWQLGQTKDLKYVQIDGKDYWYMIPGQRVQVSGTLRITDKPPRTNIYCWVGLIQEDVRIVEDHVEPRLVTVEF